MNEDQRRRCQNAVDSLLTLRKRGALTPVAVQAVAEACDVGRATMYRYLKDGGPPTRIKGKGWEWNEEDLGVLLAEGSVRAAREQMQLADPARKLPGERWMQFQLHRQPTAQQTLVKLGRRKARNKRVTVVVEPEYRNELWLADHKLLDVWVRMPRTNQLFRPSMTLFPEGLSRRLPYPALTVGDSHPSDAHVLAGLETAIRAHGVPRTLLFDRGLEFNAGAITRAAAEMNFLALSTEAYSPHLKGKVERLAQTIGRKAVEGLPHRTTGPEDRDGRALAMPLDDEGDPIEPLFFDDFVRHFHGVIDRYNDTVHSTLGATPNQVYAEDPTPERRIPDDHLLHLLMARETRVIGNYGIQFRKRHYYAPELNDQVGVKVEIRYRQDDLTRLEVFRDKKLWCTAHLANRASPEHHEQVMADRKKSLAKAQKTVRAARRHGRRRYRAISGPGDGITETTPITQSDVRPRRGGHTPSVAQQLIEEAKARAIAAARAAAGTTGAESAETDSTHTQSDRKRNR